MKIEEEIQHAIRTAKDPKDLEIKTMALICKVSSDYALFVSKKMADEKANVMDMTFDQFRKEKGI